MSENEIEVVGFQYPDGHTAQVCEDEAQAIRDLNYARVKMTIAIRVEIGARLNAVASKLAHGQFGPWVAHQFPGWSERSTQRWRTLAHKIECEKHYGNSRQIGENLHKFESVTAAEEFVTLPEEVRDAVVEREAWTRPKFQAVCWEAAMSERLEDGGLDEKRRYGDVLHAIDDVLHDDEAPAPLKDAAQELYQEHRDTFARLEGEDASVVDVEVGIDWKPPPDDDRPSAQLVEADDGQYWLCRWDGKTFQPVAPVRSRVLLWNGGTEPVTLAAFPKTNDGPAADAKQRAVIEASCVSVNASTVESVYGEVL